MSDDTLANVFTFLEDRDMVEVCHVNRSMFHTIRQHLRRMKYNPFKGACSECYHHEPHCQCAKRDKLTGLGVFFFLIAIILFCFFYPLMTK